jgi:mediator of RNA polymerase II transcription subunit 6
MASKDPPLDEVVWRSPEVAQSMQGIHSNSILFYFANSPFFDPTSNNAVLLSQSQYNPSMVHVIQTREGFQARLKTMSGLEFIVAQEPAEMAPGTGTGVWVIRKQTRRKRQGEEDEISLHSSYFVVGENIYMAPTVADVISSRMVSRVVTKTLATLTMMQLSIVSSMNKFISTAASLPDFSPSLGHTYMPPPSSKGSKGSESQMSQLSKENTPMPDALSTAKKGLTSPDSSDYLSIRLLEESLQISLKYGDEYMDENPITGQPGDFHLSTTARKDKDRLLVPAPVKGPISTPAKSAATPTPPSLKTDIPPARKGSKSEKSPKTPGGGPPKPKRRKSKALNAGSMSPI